MTLTDREREPGALTPRQHEIGRLILDGLTYNEIGRELHLSPKTVETYVTAMRYKLDISHDGTRGLGRARLFAALRQYYAQDAT